MITLNQLDDLIKKAGYSTVIQMREPIIEVYNHKNNLEGRFILLEDGQIWYSVFDLEEGSYTPEGGVCNPTVESIKDNIYFFSFHKDDYKK